MKRRIKQYFLLVMVLLFMFTFTVLPATATVAEDGPLPVVEDTRKDTIPLPAELQEIQDRIDDYFDLYGDTKKDNEFVKSRRLDELAISEMYIDEDSQKMMVCIDNMNERKIALFKELVSDSEEIVFVDQPYITLQATYNTAGAIQWGSIGWPARDPNNTSKKGFVTVAHAVGGVAINGAVKTESGTQIGALKQKHTGSLDFAFVELSSGNSVANNYNFKGFRLYTGTVNDSVSKYGKSTGKTTGTVLARNVTLTYSDSAGNYYAVPGCARANYSSSSGDSGGPVVSSDGYVIGIHIGLNSNGYPIFLMGSTLYNAVGNLAIVYL